ncbi:MAG TPA: hypothetical protein VF777_03995 [Phycisphaerales bacterium]
MRGGGDDIGDTAQPADVCGTYNVVGRSADHPTQLISDSSGEGSRMSHAVSVYTAIYLAIVFVTVSIWGGAISQLKGDVVFLVATHAIFGLKLAIDDYVHFAQAIDSRKIKFDLHISLFMYIFLAASLAFAAMEKSAFSIVSFVIVLVAGLLWSISSFMKNDNKEGIGSSIINLGKTSKSRQFWFGFVNILVISLLIISHFIGIDKCAMSLASVPLALAASVFALDFLVIGTLGRLANLK